MRFSDGQLLSAPGNVNIIGNYKQPNWSLYRQYNTCYENTAGVPVNTTKDSTGTYNTVTACDSTSPTPAFIQRLAYTSQSNAPYLNIRQQYHPLLDMSLFKQFAIREGVSFEIRGEFFNILNTPEWGGPGRAWCIERRVVVGRVFPHQSKRLLFPGQRSAYRPAYGAHQLLTTLPETPPFYLKCSHSIGMAASLQSQVPVLPSIRSELEGGSVLWLTTTKGRNR